MSEQVGAKGRVTSINLSEKEDRAQATLRARDPLLDRGFEATRTRATGTARSRCSRGIHRLDGREGSRRRPRRLRREHHDRRHRPARAACGLRPPVGAPLLEISQIGKVCHNKCAIYYQAGDCVMPREGVFAVVRQPATSVGDDRVVSLGDGTCERSPEESLAESESVRAANECRKLEGGGAVVAELTSGSSPAPTPAARPQDTAGRALSRAHAERGWTLTGYQVVPDDRLRIDPRSSRSPTTGTDIVLTCGGTGLGPRDVTPEATLAVCDRPVPGIAEHMRAESLKVTGRAMLSRALRLRAVDARRQPPRFREGRPRVLRFRRRPVRARCQDDERRGHSSWLAPLPTATSSPAHGLLRPRSDLVAQAAGVLEAVDRRVPSRAATRDAAPTHGGRYGARDPLRLAASGDAASAWRMRRTWSSSRAARGDESHAVWPAQAGRSRGRLPDRTQRRRPPAQRARLSGASRSCSQRPTRQASWTSSRSRRLWLRPRRARWCASTPATSPARSSTLADSPTSRTSTAPYARRRRPGRWPPRCRSGHAGRPTRGLLWPQGAARPAGRRPALPRARLRARRARVRRQRPR